MMRLTSLAILLLGLTACDGGGGSSGANGGIGGSGITTISQGPVSAVGSRVITGTRWDLEDAVISSDGSSGFVEADLELGTVVTIEGTRSSDGLTGEATSASFDIRIRGPIDSGSIIDIGNSSVEFTVFGLFVTADASRRWSSRTSSRSLRLGDTPDFV